MVGGQSGDLPTQVLAEQMAPMGSRGAPHYYLPTQLQIAIYTPTDYPTHQIDPTTNSKTMNPNYLEFLTKQTEFNKLCVCLISNFFPSQTVQVIIDFFVEIQLNQKDDYRE